MDRVIDKIPYEAYYDRKPKVDHFYVFGCLAHVKVLTLHLSKLTYCRKPMVFIDYDMNTQDYRMFDHQHDELW